MDSMSGCDIRLVFTFPPKDSTLQYKKCVHLWNNFPCISTLLEIISFSKLQTSIYNSYLIRQGAVVNRTSQSLHEGSREITLTVSLKTGKSDSQRYPEKFVHLFLLWKINKNGWFCPKYTLFQLEKRWYLPHYWSDKGLNGTAWCDGTCSFFCSYNNYSPYKSWGAT